MKPIRTVVIQVIWMLLIFACCEAELLVSMGLARTKGVVVKLPTGEKSKVYVERLHALERSAQQRSIGIWAGSKK